MDSKTVSKQIRKEIKPLLADNGFTRFTSRSAWRFGQETVDVVNFQSFNAYNADVLGCTTYSFSVNLGVYPIYLARELLVKHHEGSPAPEEYMCPFRRSLRKRLAQPEFPDVRIWYVDPSGDYLVKALHDVRMLLLSEGLTWFGRFASRSEVFRTLREDPCDMETGTWGFGNVPSPVRSYLLGFAAMAVGEREIARFELEKAQLSGCFQGDAERIRRALQSLA